MTFRRAVLYLQTDFSLGTRIDPVSYWPVGGARRSPTDSTVLHSQLRTAVALVYIRSDDIRLFLLIYEDDFWIVQLWNVWYFLSYWDTTKTKLLPVSFSIFLFFRSIMRLDKYYLHLRCVEIYLILAGLTKIYIIMKKYIYKSYSERISEIVKKIFFFEIYFSKQLYLVRVRP